MQDVDDIYEAGRVPQPYMQERTQRRPRIGRSLTPEELSALVNVVVYNPKDWLSHQAQAVEVEIQTWENEGGACR